jgi:hypothetical protein
METSMTAAPRIADEQLSFAGKGAPAGANPRELLTSRTRALESGLGTGERFGDLKQSLTIQWTVQER